MEAGYDARKSGTYERVNLSFDPTSGFHEYRFDYLPGRVVFYADSEKLAEMEGGTMPTSAGHLVLQHWSNGNPQWSGGPPTRDSLLQVSYVKAYFNSSAPSDRSSDEASQCTGARGPAVCDILDGTAQNASTGGRLLGNAGREHEADKKSRKHHEEEGHANQCGEHRTMAFAILLAAISTAWSHH